MCSAVNCKLLLYADDSAPIVPGICCVTRGREGREGGREGRGGVGRGGEGRGGEGGKGGMTVIHIVMVPQYLHSNHVTYYVIT